jgi:very-short-patch-repair endonuclease
VPTLHFVHPTGNAKRLRRKQTREEAQLWQTLRAGRFAGFKFRRQHRVQGNSVGVFISSRVVLG